LIIKDGCPFFYSFGLVHSCPGFSLETTLDESLCVPVTGRKHMRAIMDTEDGHLLCILKVLQQLQTNTAGEEVQQNEKPEVQFFTKAPLTHIQLLGSIITVHESAGPCYYLNRGNTYLWRDEEVLRNCLFASCPDHNVKDSPFIYRIHSLKTEIFTVNLSRYASSNSEGM